MTIAGFLGGYEFLIIILTLAIPIILIYLVVRGVKKWNNSFKEISDNQKLIIKKLDEQKEHPTK